MKKKLKPIDPHKAVTDAEWKSMGPTMRGIKGLPPKAQAAVSRMGRPRLEHPKEKVTMRFDHDVVALLRKQGRGWQTRLNHFVRDALENNRI